MSDGWIGFVGGIIAALTAAVVASLIQHASDRRKRKEEAEFSLFMDLLRLKQAYFWIASADFSDQPPPERAVRECQQIAWEIAERLRSFDDVSQLDQILSILFRTEFGSANERARKLDTVISTYGERVNPRYTTAIKAISEENVRAIATTGRLTSTAPASANFCRER